MRTAFRHVSCNVLNVSEKTYGKCSRIVSNAGMRQDHATSFVLLSPILNSTLREGPQPLQHYRNKLFKYKCIY